MTTTGYTHIDWDTWRTAYPHLTHAQQQAFHTDVYTQYPIQQHYDLHQATRAIIDVVPTTVVELGGWDGELAHKMLGTFDCIERWTNIEICREAAKAGEHRHPRYHAPHLTDFYWTQTWDCDLFIASHVIEHLTTEHLDKTIAATNARALYLDAPLTDQPQHWDHYVGTHILNIGWPQVHDLCAQHGYRLVWETEHQVRGSTATACLYHNLNR